MTAQELVDFINAKELGDWEIEVLIHGKVYRIVDGAREEGVLRLYPSEEEAYE